MTKHGKRRNARGAMLVWLAVVLVGLMAVLALALDIGYVYNVKAELRAALDAAALAGASGLPVSLEEARNRAVEYAGKNTADGESVALDRNLDVEAGTWDADGKVFTPAGAGQPANAIRVTARLTEARGNPVDLYLANVVGVNSVDMVMSSTAVFGSRDIVVVLDYSASMNDDSELAAASWLGQFEVENLLRQMWQDLGSPEYGNIDEDLVRYSDGRRQIMATLGLGDENGNSYVPYPYPAHNQYIGGDRPPGADADYLRWMNYIDYVKNVNGPPAAYRHRYGAMTLLDYWQTQYPAYGETPDLWMASEQPITAVKDAVQVFLAFMELEPTDDRVGLVSYTHSSGGGYVEVSLTADYDAIENRSRHMQAGHYDLYTNIAGGIQAARMELARNSRNSTSKLIVLLSDGVANRPYSTYYAERAALQQADYAAGEEIPILTISLGANADTDLMQQIADITNGVHFIVPGGSNVSDYEEDLNEVFAEVAAHRPLRLVD